MELKRHSVRGVKYNGEEICGGFAYYDADEVDALIAEKDKEIESLKASHYAEMVDAGMRERRLRRALWLARSDRAMAEAYNCHLADASNLWIRNARKMSAKAEEYK